MAKSWKDSFKVYAQKNSWMMLLLGFSSGLPLLLVYGTLSIWLTEVGIDRAKITQLSWIGFCYSFKFLWSPLVDQLRIPFFTSWLGKRRAWLLMTQLGVIVGLVGIAFSDPSFGISQLVWFALLVTFCSATQDIVIDAFRIEIAALDEQGALIATYTMGYRIAMMLAGAGCLAIAQYYDNDPTAGTYDFHSWSVTYLFMAAFMGLGVVSTFLVSEPKAKPSSSVPSQTLPQNIFYRFGSWFLTAIVMPFWDFFKRYKWQALLVLLLIGVYRISDIVLGTVAYQFYTELGFDKLEIAAISKVYGVIAILLGGFFAGVLMPRLGVMKMLFLGAVLAAISNLLYAVMATKGHSIGWLTVVISADNISVGIASTAFVAYLSGLTNISYTATQYALFSSFMQFTPKLLGGFSGAIVDKVGYSNFFVFTTVIGLPVLVLIALAAKYAPAQKIDQNVRDANFDTMGRVQRRQEARRL